MPDSKSLHVDADILIVDDNAVNVELLISLLEDEGYQQLQGLTDPAEAIAQVKRKPPDLILLDIRMPKMSGFDVMTELNRQLGEQAPAVIVLTAQIDDETRYKALECGAQDFLTKPFDAVEVLKRIHNTLNLQRLMTRRSEKANELEALVSQRTVQLKKLSTSDPVTGLPNRRALMSHLDTCLSEQDAFAVFFIQFEDIQDFAGLHGYLLADQLMLQMAVNSKNLALSLNGYLAVWNYDQWVMVCDNVQHYNQAEAIANQLLSFLSQPIAIDGMNVKLTLRIGACGSQEGLISAEQLLRQAALALPNNIGQWRCFEASIEKALQRKLGLRDALRAAIEKDELYLMYQPKVDLQDKRICGVEALLRWESQEFGRVSPAEFIPIAEASGEIIKLGDWVIEQALADLVIWREQHRVSQDFSIAINVASEQLMQLGFAQSLINKLEKARIPASVIEIEVTESGLMRDMELALTQLVALQEAGFSVAIDDFGTGYSSLAYLKKLPISVLKVDRAFIMDLHTNTQDQNLARTVIDMARHFNFKTVAEGVELPEQLTILQHMGCHLIQGFLFSPPLKGQALMALLEPVIMEKMMAPLHIQGDDHESAH